MGPITDEDASVPVSDIDVSKAVPAEGLSLPVTDIEPKTTASDIDEHTLSSGAELVDIKEQDLPTVGVETKTLTKKEIKEKEKREKKEKERERKAQKEMEKLA